MAQIVYENAFIQCMNGIYPEGFSKLSVIDTLPEVAAGQMLKEVLLTGCKSGNHANIELAREAILKMPQQWLLVHFPAAVKQYLFDEPDWREWEFRRLAEMVQKPFPQVFLWLVDFAGKLQDPEVDEAIADFLEPEQNQ